MREYIYDVKNLSGYRAASSSTSVSQDTYFLKFVDDQRYILGTGSFGKAFRIDPNYVLKIVTSDKKPSFVEKCLKNEETVLKYMIEKNLEHKNITKVLFFKKNVSIFEFLFATIPTLSTQLSFNTHQFINSVDFKLSVSIFIKNNFFMQVYNGLNHLHINNIYHRDIKPDNLIMTGNILGEVVVKIIDYNLSYLFVPGGNNINLFIPGSIGAPFYRSPIAKEFNTSNREECVLYFILSDIWSLIITFYELLYVHINFRNIKQKQTYFHYLESDIVPIDKKIIINTYTGYDFDVFLKFILKKMCNDRESLVTDNFNLVVLQIVNTIKVINFISSCTRIAYM